MAASSTFHQNLIEKLHALLRKGKFGAGDRFLTEREIAAKFHTSRPTANKALSSLVSAGLLEVRRGAGTFVRESVLDYNLERLVSFTDKARSAGRTPGTKLLVYREIPASSAPKSVAESLRAGGNDTLIYLERIRLADRVPVIYERRHVVAKRCRQMTRADARGSLYTCWTEKCGLKLAGADEVIHAVIASGTEAAHLGIAKGGACFRITATGHIEGGEPLWHEETLYRADRYEFRNRISGLSGTRAALGQIKADAATANR